MVHDILIIDDEADIRQLIAGVLEDEGYSTRLASDGIVAIDMIRDRQPSLIILDVWLGDSDRDGIKILELIKKDYPYVPIIMISGHSTIETAVCAIKKGAYDFLEKPFQSERLLSIMQRAIESSFLKRENDTLRVKARIDSPLVGSSSVVSQLRQAVDKIATTQGRIFITSCDGFDQETLARDIHCKSNRSKSPFIALNCSAMLPQYADVELFGLELDNNDNRIGLLERAHTGSFFLENVTYLPLPVQAKLVRFLQDNSFSRISSQKRINVDVRIIAASTCDIERCIEEQTFREDLFYRLSVTRLHIPPLRERIGDIPKLVEYYVDQVARALGRASRRFSQEAIALLQDYPWPGDMMQLRNVIEQILLKSKSNPRDPVTVDDLPSEIITGNSFVNQWHKKTSNIVVLPLKEAREAFEKEYLTTQVNRFCGNISQTARFIGMERSALHRKLRALGIHDPKQGKEEEIDYLQDGEAV